MRLHNLFLLLLLCHFSFQYVYPRHLSKGFVTDFEAIRASNSFMQYTSTSDNTDLIERKPYDVGKSKINNHALLQRKKYILESKRRYNKEEKQRQYSKNSLSPYKAISIRNDTSLNCYFSLMDGDANRPFLAELLQAAESLGKNKRIILTGADVNYRGIVMNWMAMMDNINITEYIVLCFSEDLLRIVGHWSDGGHGILVSGCISFQEMAFMKFIAMNVLVKEGYVTTWSDCDCIWLQDFFPQWVYPYQDKVDVIGQRGNYPNRFVKKIGVALCTGLVVFFPTTNAVSVLKNVLDTIPSFNESNCDQMLLNKVLTKMGSFMLLKDRKISLFSSNLDITKSVIADATVVGFLPYTQFMRTKHLNIWIEAAKQPLNNSLCVWHLQTAKYSETKVEVMDSMYLFALTRLWTKVKSRIEYMKVINISQVKYPPWPEGTNRKFQPIIGTLQDYRNNIERYSSEVETIDTFFNLPIYTQIIIFGLAFMILVFPVILFMAVFHLDIFSVFQCLCFKAKSRRTYR